MSLPPISQTLDPAGIPQYTPRVAVNPGACGRLHEGNPPIRW